MPEVKEHSGPAESIYIKHPESDWGIFVFTQTGDLFLNSDYGMYGFAWRHYGSGEFKKWLSQSEATYIVGKFEQNNGYLNSKKLHKNVIKHVTNLVAEFINVLKEQYA